MRNQTQPAPATAPKKTEALTIAFQDFNGVFIAKVSNLKDRETHAFGKTKGAAQQNALANYRLKYANS